MLHSPIVARLVRRGVQRRLRRLGGTQALAWALRVPLVTLVVVAALLMALRPGGSRTG